MYFEISKESVQIPSDEPREEASRTVRAHKTTTNLINVIIFIGDNELRVNNGVSVVFQ